MMDIYDGQKIDLKTRVDRWISMDVVGLLVYLNYTVYGAIKNNPMKEKELNNYYLLPAQMGS